MPEYKTVQNITSVGYEYKKYPDGSEAWYLNGKYHRIEGPAAKYSDGTYYWYLNGHPLGSKQIKTIRYLLICDISKLPLYINTIFKPVVEDRLKRTGGTSCTK